MKISTSFLSSTKPIKTVNDLNFTDTDFIHIDYIDNSFIDGKKISFSKIKKIVKNSRKRLDVHIMSSKLKKNIKRFASLNSEYITFHIELNDIEKYIFMIHSYGIKCGLAISPNTDLEKVIPYLSMIDMVLVMSVIPGQGGQKFLDNTVSKLEKLRKYIMENEIKTIISVDGGINNETIKKVKPYVDMVVSGSYITNSNDYQENINSLR